MLRPDMGTCPSCALALDSQIRSAYAKLISHDLVAQYTAYWWTSNVPLINLERFRIEPDGCLEIDE